MRGKASNPKKTVCLILAVAVVFCLMPVEAGASPDISAKACALIEASTKRILLSYNGEIRLPMASTTKIMTCILAIENGDMNAVVEVDDQAVGVEGSSMYLQKGESLTLRELLYGLMLCSGNDAAVAVAVYIGGSVEKFAEMMNAKARSIGAADTNFVTPNGLPNDNHYTTAIDLALISAYAMQNQTFREIVSTASMDLSADEDSPARYLRSKNKILYQYEGGNGIKTGYTDAAGKCLSAAAYQEDMQLIAVVLNDYDMFADCQELLDYGFQNYDMLQVVSAGEKLGEVKVEEGVAKGVETVVGDDIILPLRAEEYTIIEKKINLLESVRAPVTAGMTVGRLELWLDGTLYAVSDILTVSGVSENTYEFNLFKILDDWLGLAERR